MPVAHPQIGRCLGMGLTVKPLALRLEKEGRQAVFQRIHLIAGSGAGDADGLFIGKNTELPEKNRVVQHLLPAFLQANHPAGTIRSGGDAAGYLLHTQKLHFAQKTRPFHKVQDGDSAVLMAHGTPGFSLLQVQQLGGLLPFWENDRAAGVTHRAGIGGDVKREQFTQGFSFHIRPSSVRFLL